ncbi:ceramide synthase 2 [Pundamilia nyererei]|uniref:Ceramide synthase 2 n=1 Tax=Pundamilia nyererei TaxID=303518 RepID=A0A9Y3VF77_9CICH|nr:PREDICTED: ceramide synthase 2-like [Pundamilia nyererei]
MLQTVGEWIWWDRLWLPGNLSWSALEDKEGRVYAKVSHLYASLPCALCLLVVRYLFERYFATPLANFWGIRDKIRLPAEQNPILEKYFCSQTRVPSQADVWSLCKKTGWPERRVQVWFRRRRNQERPGLRKRFSEASWRCAFYLFAFFGGILALYDKPWVYNLREVWAGFPKQSLLPSQYWYYMLEMGFYLSLVFSLTFDVKRKGAKVFNYATWQQTSNGMFVVFAVVFMVTRLIVFPFWLIHCTWVYPLELYPAFFGYYFFNVMLLVLQLLHLYWAALILRMVYKFIFTQLEGDDRSDKEEDDSDPPIERNHKPSHMNGSGARGRANGH